MEISKAFALSLNRVEFGFSEMPMEMWISHSRPIPTYITVEILFFKYTTAIYGFFQD